MTSVTKVFRFEMGHAIHNYGGLCKYIHGHSYVLHVTVTAKEQTDGPLPAPGFVIDFKDLKKVVNEHVIDLLDHALVLSEDYMKAHPEAQIGKNIFIWPYEPSAENILYFIREKVSQHLPEDFKIVRMRLWETADSFAEWENPN